MMSSSQRRPRAMAQTRRARRSARSGRNFSRGVPCGTRSLRNRVDNGFCQGIEKTSGSVLSLVGLREMTSWFLWTAMRERSAASSARSNLIGVRLQMLWDNPSCIGKEVLARWGWSLGGFRLVLQSSLFDGVAFDPFSFQKDGLAAAEVDVGRGEVL